MFVSDLPMSFGEKVTFSLRSLYNIHGYSQYRMSKFEEYDLYARNKDFLISDSVITFTDGSGKLMALKPDVTLSIVKNTKDAPSSRHKVYYNENVYRADKGSNSFREIMQVGLECLGDIDDYCISEVIMLAAMSLEVISQDFVLDVSDLGLVLGVISALGISEGLCSEIIKCIGEKNENGIRTICLENGIAEESADILCRFVNVYGSPFEVLPMMRELLCNICDVSAIDRLLRILSCLDKNLFESVRIDFSVVDNINYYNGIVFKGFVRGIPESVLSGGCYDNLMEKMNKRSGAIGFAVYTDRLSHLFEDADEYDVDTLLVYDAECSIEEVHAAASRIAAGGISVSVMRDIPSTLRYKRLMKLKKGEVETLA